MSTLSSANVTDDNLVLKERTHMRLCLNMLIFTHDLGNWLIGSQILLGIIPKYPGSTADGWVIKFHTEMTTADNE